jgi:hypothetical protein
MGIRAPSVRDTFPRVYQCPECTHEEPTPELLGSHLERHREVVPAGDTLHPCAKGCGRHFPRGYNGGGRDKHNHEAICDGRPPLTVEAEEPEAIEPKEATMAKLECKFCGKKYKHAKRLETHAIECEAIGRRAESKPTVVLLEHKSNRRGFPETDRVDLIGEPSLAADRELTPTEQTLFLLRARETYYQGKLNEVHGLIDAVKATEGKK